MNKILQTNSENRNNKMIISLSSEQNLLRENDYNVIVDTNEQYQKERNDSIKYKIFNKIKMVFRNQYLGTTSFAPLIPTFYLNNDGTGDSQGYLQYNEFAFLRNDVFREYNETPKGNDLKNYTLNLKPKNLPQHRLFTIMDNPYYNWGFSLSYVYDKDENYVINYTFSNGENFNNNISEGIPFRVTETDDSYILTSPIEHNIKEGESLIISNKGNVFKKIENNTIITTSDIEDRVFQVNSVGDGIYNSEKFVITLSKDNFVLGTTLNKVIFVRRCLDNNNLKTVSKYYIRKHKILTDEKEYTLDRLGFETNIFEHERKILFENLLGDNDVLVERNRMETILCNLNDTFKLENLKDNNGLTPREIFLTIYFKNSNGLFNYPPKVGYKFNFHSGWVDKHFEGNSSNENGIEVYQLNSLVPDLNFYGGKLNKDDVVNGDIVEYNEYELKEYVISKTFHKITSRLDIFDHKQNIPTPNFNGINNNNLSGLYYQTHYPIQLRSESPYVETSFDKDIINLPENSKYFEDEKMWRWRDLYDNGYIDEDNNGVNHPFLNGYHYLKTDINFYLRNETGYKNKTDVVRNFNDKQDEFC